MGAHASPVIRVTDLEFRYGEGDFRLRIPDLQVSRGPSAAFIGPSGSGKTTLLHLLAGIVLPGRCFRHQVLLRSCGQWYALRERPGCASL